MSEQLEIIDNLKKVRLLLKALIEDEGSKSTGVEEPYEFIFGIGSEGLSPIEMKLRGLKRGDELTFETAKDKWRELFGHLHSPSLPGLEKNSQIALKISVEDVGPAEQREIVQAMSGATTCGSDCCSHH